METNRGISQGNDATWDDALSAWGSEQAAGNYSPGTTRLRKHHVKGLARRHPCPGAVTRADIIAYLARPDWAPETRKSAGDSIRAFFQWAAHQHLVAVNPAKDLPTVRIPPPCPRPAPDDVIDEALADVRREDVAVMLTLAAVAGLRRAEIAQVHTRDLAGRTLHVHGKGRRERHVPLPAGLAMRIRSAGTGYLFPGRCGGHFSPDWVGRLMSRALPGRWTAHTLRHAAATAWAALGLDLDEIRDLLGHSSTEVTSRYVARPQERVREVLEQAAARFAQPRRPQRLRSIS